MTKGMLRRFIKASWWLWLLSALVFGGMMLFNHFSPLPLPPNDVPLIEFEAATKGGTECYKIPLVSSVRTQGAPCPAESDVRQVIEDFMRETETTADEIRVAKVWFTDRFINCVNCDKCQSKALGCTNGFSVAVLLHNDWPTTLKVELCHVRELARTRDLDGDHTADCYPAGSVIPGQ